MSKESIVSQKLRQVSEITNPLELVSRGLMSGSMKVPEAVQALKGMSILIDKQCNEIIRDNPKNRTEEPSFDSADAGIGYHHYIEVSAEELNYEVRIVSTATGGIDVIADRLEQERISLYEAAQAITGLAILIRHKCSQIIEQE